MKEANEWSDISKARYRDWQIRLKNIHNMELPLRFFEFDFAEDKKAEAHYDMYMSTRILRDLPFEELKKRRVPKENIQIGAEVIGCLGMNKQGKFEMRGRKLVVKENYQDTEEQREKGILCLDIVKEKDVHVPINNIFVIQKTDRYNQVELDGLRKYENMREFQKIILAEDELRKPMFVKIVDWKRTHLRVSLRKFKWCKSINTKLIFMIKSLEINRHTLVQHFDKNVECHRKAFPIAGPAVSFDIDTGMDCWIKWTAKLKRNATLGFHVSSLIQITEPYSMLIHPVKYWKQLQQLEKDLKKTYAPLLGREKYVPIEHGPFVIVAENHAIDDYGRIIKKFYRGIHKGDYLVSAPKHKIEFIDYATTKTVDTKNLVPMKEEHSSLGAMGCICQPILVLGKGEKVNTELLFFQNQDCVGEIESWEIEESGRVTKLVIKDIKVISSMDNLQGHY